MTPALSILLLQGDSEARLLAGAGVFLRGVFPHAEVEVTAAFTPRADLLGRESPPPPPDLRRSGLIADVDPRDLLERPYQLVVLSLLPSVVLPLWRHSGGAFLPHVGLRAGWPHEVLERIRAESVEEPPLAPADAAASLESMVLQLKERGTEVAVCTSFRHVKEPLVHQHRAGAPSLRERVRQVNLEVARLSRRTGCFVLDLDRPLAQEGGARLAADCFGGDGRAAEIALDEFLGLLFDVLPADALSLEGS